MSQHLGLVSVVVQDYDDALDFYVEKLGFRLVEDTCQPAQSKRWVVVSPPGATECHLLLAQASNDHQATRIGDQTGGRVFLFLYTDDFWRDFNAYKAKGVVFVREPRSESYGTVAVFSDLHGNLWDLIQPVRGSVQSDAQPLSEADPLRQALQAGPVANGESSQAGLAKPASVGNLD